jgi:hypothetical protein
VPAVRKRTNVLKLTNAGHRERMRARDGEVISDGPIGDAPERMPEIAKAVWREISATAPWFRIADRYALEVLSVLMAQFREQLADTPPHVFIRMETMFGRLGLTPADRSKVKDPGYRLPRNEFADE